MRRRGRGRRCAIGKVQSESEARVGAEGFEFGAVETADDASEAAEIKVENSHFDGCGGEEYRKVFCSALA